MAPLTVVVAEVPGNGACFGHRVQPTSRCRQRPRAALAVARFFCFSWQNAHPLIALNASAGKIYEHAILILGKRLPRIFQKLNQCGSADPGVPRDRAKGDTFAPFT